MMTSLISKKEYKDKLIDFVENQNLNELKYLKELLVNEKNCTSDYPSSPGKPSLENISSTGEKAFQRAIYNNEVSFLKSSNNTDKVSWLDLELPVTLNKNPRRVCIDLIGSLDGIPVLCELKYFEKSPSNHPIYAIVELLVYKYLIFCNHEKLDKYDVHHHLRLKNFKWEVIVKNRFPFLLIVANKKYWDYWFIRISKNDLLKLVFNLGSILDTNIRLYETNDEDFINQKDKRSKYTPKLTSNIWTRITRDKS